MKTLLEFVENRSMSISRWLMVLAAVVLTACGAGGGGGLADTGVGGSGGAIGSPGRIVGPFQGLGSIIVNDRTLSTSGTEFDIEDGLDETDLREGQRIVVFADLATNDAEQASYRSDIKGPVTGVTIIDPLTATAEVQVMGQLVLTNSATRFDGVSLGLLVAGDVVEVSGSRDASGQLVATYLGLRAGLSEYKTVGLIGGLDTAAMTFELDGLTVDYSSATLSEFEGAQLTNGQAVEIRLSVGDFSPPASAVASEVELLTASSFEDGEEVEYEGYIDRFISPSDFDVDGLPVQTNAGTVYVNGSAASLALNVKVEVEGTVNVSGTLIADRIVFKPTNAVRVEGTLSAIDQTASTVTTTVGLTFEVRGLTELEDDRDGVEPFGLADLQVGDYVELRGFLDGPVLVAAELERDDFDTQTSLRGPVTAEDEPAGTVAILGITVTGVVGVTSYDTTQSAFHAAVELGTFVEAEWDPFNSTDDPAGSLSIED